MRFGSEVVILGEKVELVEVVCSGRGSCARSIYCPAVPVPSIDLPSIGSFPGLHQSHLLHYLIHRHLLLLSL